MISLRFNNNPNLALDIFHTLSVGYEYSFLENLIIKYILKDCKNRQEVLNKVIEICGKPNTPQKRYIHAITYACSNKEYRDKAIYYLELYLNNELWEEGFIHKFKNIKDAYDIQKKDHIYDLTKYLAEIYAKEYKFNDSLKNYEKMIELDPYLPFGYSGKVSTLIKQHKIDEAIFFLKKVKKSKYYIKNEEYSPNTWLIDSINNLLKDCINKKEKNYVYKPRKNNEIY